MSESPQPLSQFDRALMVLKENPTYILISNKLLSLAADARQLSEIKDKDDMEMGILIVADVRTNLDQLDKMRLAATKPYRDHVDAVNAFFKKGISDSKVQEESAALEQRTLAFDRVEKGKALDAIKKQAADVRSGHEGQENGKHGDTHREALPMPQKLSKQTEGLGSLVTTYSFEVIDAGAIPLPLMQINPSRCTDPILVIMVPRDALVPNPDVINSVIEEAKKGHEIDSLEIPGLKIIKTESLKTKRLK